ncbi:MAG: tetratricopeptide repeat protein [Phycisphaerales bacterium]
MARRPTNPAAPARRRRVSSPSQVAVALVAVLVGAVVFAAFAPSLSAGLVDLDDYALLRDNPAYRGLSGEHLGWMFTTTMLGHYQPLTWVSYALDYLLSGEDWRQFHFTNVLIHAANAGLVCVLLARVLAVARGVFDRWSLAACAAAAVFWGAHPLRAESVAWVTERRDVLSTLFLLLCALAYLRAFAPGDRGVRSRGWYAASVALLAVSLLAKAWGMTFFVMAMVMDSYPLRRLDPRPRAWFRRDQWRVPAQKVPYALLGLAAMVMAGLAQRSAAGAVRSLEEWPAGARLAQAAYGLVFYLWKTAAPAGLSPMYEMPAPAEMAAPRYWVCGAAVALIVAAVWALRRRAPGVAAAMALYAIAVAPVLGFFQSGDQLVADRYSYLASIPLAALLAAGLARAGGAPGTRRLLAPMVAIILALFWWMTLVQVRTWHSAETLWRRALSVAPTKSAHVNLGLALQHGGKLDEAIPHYRAATALDPEDGRAWFVLGNALRSDGDRAGAEAAYRRAADRMPQAFMAYVNLARLIEEERPDEALELYREAVRDLEGPRAGSHAGRTLSGVPYLALGSALNRRARPEEARAAFERALEYPDSRERARVELARLGPR